MPPKNTSALLKQLRGFMKNKSHVNEPLDAYIIPTDDAHQSEHIADCDQRRVLISGFTGSAGTVIITETQAALWTDGRYFLQAEAELSKDWTLMKEGLPTTPSKIDWLKKVLPQEGRVGVDPYLFANVTCTPIRKQLRNAGHSLVAVSQNLIDLCWADQPAPPTDPVFIQSIKFAGQSWQDKVVAVREKMKEQSATALVITALDEVAWLLNLRGSDIEFNPCFLSYIILTMDSVEFFVNEQKLSDDVKQHLVSNGNKTNVNLHPYGDIMKELEATVNNTSSKIWISDKSSWALVNAVPKRKRVSLQSPVDQLKAVKNETEIKSMKNAHIKDAVALCEYFCWLEKEVKSGNITEIAGADKLDSFRRQQQDYVSLSFSTISASGPNGAIIHYRPSEETDRKITTEELYLCDSGAQFRDGTTDVTRTVHFGTPTEHEQECFTRVLKGHIALGSVVIPNGVKGLMLDSFARSALWEAGLDYAHGTGHGVGAFLNCHEGPCSVSYRARPDEVALQEGMILSDEPGYYEDGKFGIRIESLFVVKKANTKFNFREKGFLTFEMITLLPIQKKMILPALLTEKELNWVNDYHQRCRDVVGPVLKKQGRTEAYNWLIKGTEPIG